MSLYKLLITVFAALLIANPVFAQGTVVTPTKVTQSVAAATTKLNLNTVSVKELSKVQGLDTAKAKAMVNYRKKHGDFKSFEDLTKVRSLKKLKPEELQAVEAQLSLS